jgi:hypothetical protein
MEMMLQIPTGKMIVDSATIVASLIGMLWLGYLAWAKHCDTRLKIAQADAEAQVKIAKENSSGAEAIRKIEEANAQRDRIIEKLESADRQAMEQDDKRRREAERYQEEVRDFKRQMEARVMESDRRLFELLQGISARNPYAKMMDKP